MITEDTASSDKVTIAAPIELVWEILLDFENYESWNSFCPSIKNKALEIGEAVDMMVNLAGNLGPQTEYLCRIDPLECIAWQMKNEPDDPVKAVRSQLLERIDDTTCTYVSIDEFSGPGAKAMMEAFAVHVETGFNQCAYDLKAHAESTYKN